MLARKSLLILLNNLVGGVLGLLLLYFVGHRMGPEPLGRFAYAWALVSVLGLLGELGTGQAHFRRVAGAGSDLGTPVGTFAALRLTQALAIVTVGLLLFGVVSLLPGIAPWNTGKAPAGLLLAALLTLCLQMVRSIPLTTFSALRQTARQELVVLIEHLVRFPATLLVVLVYGELVSGDAGSFPSRWLDVRAREAPTPEDGALWLALALLVAIGASTAVSLLLFRRSRIPWSRPTRKELLSYVRAALPFALVTGITVLSTNIDRVMLGLMRSDVDVGLFHGASRLYLALLIVPGAASGLLFSRFSELLVRGDRGVAGELVSGATSRLMLVTFPVVVLTAAFTPEGVRLVLGTGFQASGPVLRILLPSVLFMAATTAFSSLIAGSEKPSLLGRATLAASLANIALNLLLIPDRLGGVPLFGLGAAGAALATSLSSFLGAGLYWRYVTRLISPPPFHRALIAQGLAALIALGSLLAWKASPLALPFERWWALLIGGAVGLGLHAGLLALFRALGPGDVRFFRELLDAGPMRRYVATELSTQIGNPPP